MRGPGVLLHLLHDVRVIVPAGFPAAVGIVNIGASDVQTSHRRFLAFVASHNFLPQIPIPRPAAAVVHNRGYRRDGCYSARLLARDFASHTPRAVFIISLRMKAYVYVSLKKSVLDPQGKTIYGALRKMGYQGVGDVRQGKYFELTLDGGLGEDAARREVERIAREVLTNPVIEEFRFSLEP